LTGPPGGAPASGPGHLRLPAPLIAATGIGAAEPPGTRRPNGRPPKASQASARA